MTDLSDQLRELQAREQNSLKDQLVDFQESQQSGNVMDAGEARRIGFFDRSVNTLGNVPAGISEIGGQALAAAGALANTPGEVAQNFFRGEPANLLGEFLASRQEGLQTTPVEALRNFPRPPDNLGEQFRAIGSAADPRNIFQQDRPPFDQRLTAAREREKQRTEQAQSEFPTATTTGEIGSDVTSLLLGRGPLARARAPGQAAKRAAVIDEAKQSLDTLPTSVRGKVDDVFTEKVIPFFKESGERTRRGLGKATETGLEGALFAAINEGDLETSFGLAAGAQGAGSLSLFLLEKPSKRLLPAVGLAWVASEMMKAVGPGEQDFFESKDFAIQKTVAALGLGAASALMGLGRFRGATAERFPAFMDAITAVPRGVLVSRLAEITKDEDARNVMERFATNPSAFNQNQQNSLMRALQSEKEGAFTTEVKRLMNNPDFARRLQPRDLNDPVEQLRSFTPTQPIQRN